MEGNGGSLKDGAEIYLRCSCAVVSWFCGLVSSQDLIFIEVDVTLKNAEFFRSVLSGEGGSADGWRNC
jgi:hypothetical protein